MVIAMTDDHLNSNRIRQMAALRRAAIRSRSYCVIALGGCVVGAADLVFFAVHRLLNHPNGLGILVAIVYFLVAALLIFLARYFLRLARRFHEEAGQSAIPPPPGPPDFSQLQNGSQIVRNLHDIK
jgi:threonine/homoserine/homoserine lactone efflux protein